MDPAWIFLGAVGGLLLLLLLRGPAARLDARRAAKREPRTKVSRGVVAVLVALAIVVIVGNVMRFMSGANLPFQIQDEGSAPAVVPGRFPASSVQRECS